MAAGHKACVNTLRKITVEPVLLLYMYASYLSFSAFMAITYDKSCLSLYNSTFCTDLDNKTFAKVHKSQQDDVQATSSGWMMRSNIAMGVPSTLSLLLWMGSWGDRVGRRLPLVVPCAGDVLYSVCNLINAIYMDASPAFLMIGQVFSGLSGGYLAMLMASYTYLTHLASPDRRMMRVGVAEAAVFLAGTISVFLSGKLVDTLGFVPVFGISLGCQVAAFVYAIFILPDIKPTLEEKGDNSTGRCQGVFLRPLRDMWTFVTTSRDSQTRLHLTLLILVINILQFCTTGEGDVLLLYLKRAPRSWSYTTYGYFKGAENFTRGATVLIILPLLKQLTSLRDTTLIMAGHVSKMAGLILLGLAKETWVIFLVVGVAALQGFPSAGLRASMAGLVNKNEQGRLFGVVAATESITSSLSTVAFNGLYPLTLDFYDGFCFQMAAFLVFICFFVVLYQHVTFKRSGILNAQGDRNKETKESEGYSTNL